MSFNLGQDWEDFWGKAQPAEGYATSWHPLWMHSLDVAAVGDCLVRTHKSLFARIEEWTSWPPEETAKLFVFLLTLHDLGKFTRAFQFKSEKHWPERVLGPIDAATRHTGDPGHPLTGMLLLRECFQESTDRWFPGWHGPDAVLLLGAVLGHHGRPVGYNVQALSSTVCRSEEKRAAQAYVSMVEGLLTPSALTAPPPKVAARISWIFAGLAVLADWLGSNQKWFPYRASGPSPEEYWRDHALPRARTAIAESGLSPISPNPKTGFRALTELSFTPAPVQAWAETVELPDGPLLILIEDMTGSGKTEAALILAHRLIATGRARGLYVGLPTMATANAMYGRLGKIYRRIFADASRPTLALAHGRAKLNSDFFSSVLANGNNAPKAQAGRGDRNDDGDSAAESTAWLASETRKSLLADVGVGTIDQALLGVLPAKFQSLRLIGLSEKVLIIDEAHAYDAYMRQELDRLVAFQAALGSHTIILSATLPAQMRKRMKDEWAKAASIKPPELTKQDYPLTTLLATARPPREETHEPRADLPRTIRITRLESVEAVVEAIRDAADAGGAVAWIRNTVDDVIDAERRLTERGLSPEIFHARFAMGDRVKIENGVVARFGRQGAAAERRGVLVASQVIEQSLDLDFDLIVSDLAPVDLLIQRAGRLWRHMLERPVSSRPIPGPEFIVLSPDPKGAITKDWYKAMFPRASAVYDDPLLLWRSAARIFETGEIRLPGDLRALIEFAYRTETDDDPAALLDAHEKARGRHSGERSFADANLLKVACGYEKDSQPWMHETKVSTRLSDENRILRLARWDGTTLEPWSPAETPELSWAMSEVTVRLHKVADRANTSSALATAIADVMKTWGRYDAEKLLIPLEHVEEDVWRATVLAGKEGGEIEEKQLFYSPRRGLIFI